MMSSRVSGRAPRNRRWLPRVGGSTKDDDGGSDGGIHVYVQS